MARWAIGDIQGCGAEFDALLHRIDFTPGRDQLWLVGDLINRGPQSLRVLRQVRALGAHAITVLGNHDLHLLAVAWGDGKLRKNDTLDDILTAPDRDELLKWLASRPLAHWDEAHGDLMLHAGVVPQWTPRMTLELAGEVQLALREDPTKLLRHLYGDQPDHWRRDLSGPKRLRFAINVLTRLRFCTVDGRIDFKQKGRPDSAPAPWIPWFRAPERASREVRIVFGHWSALGLLRERRLLALDTGCVWGGTLTAVNLDDPGQAPVSEASQMPRATEE